ncbi:MAG: flagellar filament capping protein FliD [Burkholderiaceae bacterium]
MATSISGTSGAIDVNAIVSSLMEIERQPLQALEQRASGLQTTISEFGKLQAALDKLQSASRDLSSLTTWQAATASSADDTAVGIRADGGALTGSYSVKVTGLASHQTLVGEPVPDKQATVSGGTMTIQMGSMAGGFVADPERAAIDIPIPAGATLEEVSAAINGADAGVGASLVTEANGTRLMIRSTDSGEDQAFQVTVADIGLAGQDLALASFAHTPGAGGPGAMTESQQAANATFELNGLPLESKTNSPEGVLENVTFTFKRITASPVDVSIDSDGETIRASMDAFIEAYNQVNGLIREQTKYDSATGKAGPLQGNRTVLRVQSQLRDILRTALPENPADVDAYQRLSDIGVEIQRDGSLNLNDSRFELAAANPERLETLFANGGVDTALHGFARRFDTLVGQVLGLDGAISGATDSLRERQNLITDQEDRLNLRLADIERRLIRQYSALDANLSQLGGALASLNQLNNG